MSREMCATFHTTNDTSISGLETKANNQTFYLCVFIYHMTDVHCDDCYFYLNKINCIVDTAF